MKFSALFFLFIAYFVAGDEEHCPRESGTVINIGSSIVQPIAEAWAQDLTNECNTISITISGGGSSKGRRAVCDEDGAGNAADIGSMSRDWKMTEGTKDADGYTFTCPSSGRKVIQVAVALDAIALFVKDDINTGASQCINLLGGLNLDQLRWIFSNYTESQLSSSGWNASSVPNNNADGAKVWSDLDNRCVGDSIQMFIPSSIHGTHDYFKEVVFSDELENFDENALQFNDTLGIAPSVGFNAPGIGFGSFNLLNGPTGAIEVAVQSSSGSFVTPSLATIADGTYEPLSRLIYMNLWDNEESLKYSGAFVLHGLNEGGALVTAQGYVELTPALINTMKSRIPVIEDEPEGCPCFFPGFDFICIIFCFLLELFGL